MPRSPCLRVWPRRRLPLLALTSAGDHVLVTDSVYGPTRRFCNNHLTRLGVEVSYYDPLIGSGIEREMRPNTRVVFLESPGSLSFEVQDVPAIAAVAHAHGALVLLDNTWATPLHFRAFDHGVDVSLHAGTKYLGGHSDLLIGLIVGNKASFPRLHRLWTDTGVTASSDDCFLALRGLRTLAVRLERHQASALRIAQWLREREEVAEVIYPALPGCARARAVEARFHRRLRTVRRDPASPRRRRGSTRCWTGCAGSSWASSWGGFESLILPINDAVRSATRWAPGGPYIRLHVGLEDPDDLIDDLAGGLARLRA